MGIPVEEAVKRLVIQQDYDNGSGPQPCVHTFRQVGLALFGAHHTLESLRAEMVMWGVDFSGPAASQTGHGLVLIDNLGPLFIEAEPDGAA